MSPIYNYKNYQLLGTQTLLPRPVKTVRNNIIVKINCINVVHLENTSGSIQKNTSLHFFAATQCRETE